MALASQNWGSAVFLLIQNYSEMLKHKANVKITTFEVWLLIWLNNQSEGVTHFAWLCFFLIFPKCWICF